MKTIKGFTLIELMIGNHSPAPY
ncbi:prepilin-type N-terminal cleavage/methylation domain-containing protein [Shewanella sp. 202IG2-18]|nr:prepilin-type N-terminal cleavage/methylation domain-containing protein [Parashewanella hymeniacidonis]